MSDIVERLRRMGDRGDKLDAEAVAEIERLRVLLESHRIRADLYAEKLIKAAAFLETLAERIEGWDRGLGNINRCEVAAAECRAMAEKLRK